MEIKFVTGKGGVGKSAVAAALALKQSLAGKKTILVELGDQSFYEEYLGTAAVAYLPQKLKQNLDIAQWSGALALREYAIHLLKVERLYDLFFENSVSKALINIAPGLSELAILGKITSGPPRNVGPPIPYDCIVVDAFASGNFMALLQAPVGLAAAIRLGPMAEQSRAITAVLKDPNICSYHVVGIPEELPVVEGIELAQKIEQAVGVKPSFILNQVLKIPPKALKEKAGSLADFQKFLQLSDERHRQMSEKLHTAGFTPHELSMVLENDTWKVIETLAGELKND